LSKIPTSLFGRGTKLLGLASKLALEEASARLKGWENEKDKLLSRVQMAQDMVKTLSQLKGASMKVGQLLSLDMGDYLPPEIVSVLEQLHHQSTFLDFDKIEKIIKHELAEKYSHFSEITKTPIAAASIGQVHQAKLDGKNVVIKVQYPGVAESIPSDLKIFEIIIKQANFFQGKRETDLTSFFEEIKEVLIKESDYKNELSMHLLYKEKFKDSPYVIPAPYEDFSTGKVLTQDFVEGVTFGQWLQKNPDQETRQKISDLMMKLYLEEVFTHGIVQTDPNPSNFMITPDNRIALLDFGAVKVYSADFVSGYRDLLLYAYEKNSKKVIEQSFKLKFIDPREDQVVRDLYLEMMEFLVEPFRPNEPFDFNDKSFFIRSRDLSWEMTKKCKYSPPPKDLLFLHRKLAGVFIFIKKMQVKVRLQDYWRYVENRSY
jgi:aarF domain-containing kinase